MLGAQALESVDDVGELLLKGQRWYQHREFLQQSGANIRLPNGLLASLLKQALVVSCVQESCKVVRQNTLLHLQLDEV